MSKHTLEQVLEALINKEDGRASELLHQYFVSKGKSIYEELSQFDDQIEEEVGGAADADFEDEIVANEADLEDEMLFSEADEAEEDPMSADEPEEDEATAELAMGDDEEEAEEPEELEGEEGEEGAAEQAEDALENFEDALADLKAAFAEIMGEEPADEMPAGEEEMADDELQAMGESTSLKAVPAAKMGDDGQFTKSPVASSKRIDGNGAKAVDFTGEGDKGMATPGSKVDDAGNVNKVGNAKAPALKSVAAPKASDAASNKTSPVAKS